MKYINFKTKAISEDSRNVFQTCICPDFVPLELREFFSCCNPVDVEISYPVLGAVRFYPVEELEQLHDDYGFEEGNFIFATTNGDAIFLKDGKVYCSLHGHYNPELLATSFDKFLEKYIHGSCE